MRIIPSNLLAGIAVAMAVATPFTRSATESLLYAIFFMVWACYVRMGKAE